jgi:hypothetical protein
MLYVLVAGSRTWDLRGYVCWVLDRLLQEHDRLVLFHGASRGGGADAHADWWATRWPYPATRVGVRRFPVDLVLDGPWPAAGHRRNERMVAEFASDVDAAGARDSAQVHGFLRDSSPGTIGCLKAARRAGFAPTVYRYEEVSAGG